MFIVRQFFEPVSEDLNEFKELVNRTFPNIIDTKFVSSSEAFKDLFSSSKLEFLLKKVAEPPFEPVKIGETKVKFYLKFDFYNFSKFIQNGKTKATRTPWTTPKGTKPATMHLSLAFCFCTWRRI